MLNFSFLNVFPEGPPLSPFMELPWLLKGPDVPWGCNPLLLHLASWLAGCLLGFSPVQMASPLNQRRMTHGFLILLQVATLLVRAHFLGVQIIKFHLCHVFHNYIILLIMLDDKVIKIQPDQNQNKIWKQMSLAVSSLSIINRTLCTFPGGETTLLTLHLFLHVPSLEDDQTHQGIF